MQRPCERREEGISEELKGGLHGDKSKEHGTK